MYWPDTQTGVDVEPARKPVASAVRKFFTEGGAGQPPTVPGGDWFNQVTNELLNVLAAAGIDPSKADDDQLLQAINGISKALSAREALRRTYAEAGYTLVPGSFELGGTVTTATDVLLDEATGIAYSGYEPFPQDIAAGTSPVSSGFVARNTTSLRSDLAEPAGAAIVGFQQEGTGSAERTAQDKLRERVSVADKGAVGDGVTDSTLAFQKAAELSPGGIYADAGHYIVTADIDAPIFANGKVYITGGGKVSVIEMNRATDDINRLSITGRRANQIFQLSAPILPVGISGVSQGLMIDEDAGVYYMTWDDGSNNVIFRKFDAAGVTLTEYTIPNLGHGDSLSKATWNGETVYLMGGSGPGAGKIHVIKNDALLASLPFTIVDRAGGCAIAVDQFTGDKVAIFYRNSAGDLRIAHSIPLADIMNGVAASKPRDTFTFNLPANDGAGLAVSMQSLAYYNGDLVVWAGSDSRSGMKLLIRYDRFGTLLEQIDVQVDRLYADVEGNITEPEGLSVCYNQISGTSDIHLVKCFGGHSSTSTIIRVYELAGGESDNAVFVEGAPERAGAGAFPLRIVDVPIILEKTAGGWAANVGSTVSGGGKWAASNVRVDLGGNFGIYFDLYKPYVSLVGYQLTQSAGLTVKRLFASWTVVKGGSATAKDHKISIFDVNANAFVSGNDPLIAGGASICLTLRLGFHK